MRTEHCEDQSHAEDRRHKVRAAPVNFAADPFATRQQIELRHAHRHVAQPHAHHLSKAVGHLRKMLGIHVRPHGHVTEGIEVLHRQTQFVVKEIRRVVQQRATAGQIHPLRRCTALLCTVKLNGLRNLLMQTNHHISCHLGHDRLIGIRRLFVRAAQVYETMLQFVILRRLTRHFRALSFQFGQKLIGYVVRADANTTCIKRFALDEQHVGCLCSNVQQQCAALHLTVVVHERIAQRRHRAVDHFKLQLVLPANVGDALHLLGLHRHQQHVQLARLHGAQNLVIPLHLIQRERHVLLRLILNDLPHLRSLHRRRAQRLGEHHAARRTHVARHALRSNLIGIQRVLQSRPQRIQHTGLAILFLCLFRFLTFRRLRFLLLFRRLHLLHRVHHIAQQLERSTTRGLKLSHLQVPRPKVNCYERFHVRSNKPRLRTTFAVRFCTINVPDFSNSATFSPKIKGKILHSLNRP